MADSVSVDRTLIRSIGPFIYDPLSDEVTHLHLNVEVGERLNKGITSSFSIATVLCSQVVKLSNPIELGDFVTSQLILTGIRSRNFHGS